MPSRGAGRGPLSRVRCRRGHWQAPLSAAHSQRLSGLASARVLNSTSTEGRARRVARGRGLSMGLRPPRVLPVLQRCAWCAHGTRLAAGISPHPARASGPRQRDAQAATSSGRSAMARVTHGSPSVVVGL